VQICFVMPDAPKEYLDYLDKEMTIMGILSTFSAAAAALALDRIGGAEPAKGSLFTMLWTHEAPYVLAGSGWLIAAALFFYLQRSLLAYYYGAISFSIHRPGGKSWTVQRWLEEADAWSTWFRYRIGFVCLVLAASMYALALLGQADSDLQKYLQQHRWPIWAAPIIASLEQVPHLWILNTYRYEQNPWDKIFRRSRKEQRHASE
jgi:hypothetical protein